MATCTMCQVDFEDDPDQVEVEAECGHHFHEDCLLMVTDGTMLCPGCYPDDVPKTDPSIASTAYPDTDGETSEGETSEDETTEDEATEPVPVEPVAVTPAEAVPVGAVVPGGAVPADVPAADLGETQRTVAARAATAITRATDAAAAASSAADSVVELGAPRGAVTGAVDGIHAALDRGPRRVRGGGGHGRLRRQRRDVGGER